MSLHKIHARHQKNKIDQKEPMPLESNFAFLDESLPDIVTGRPNTLALDVRISLGQEQSKNDEQHRRCSAEPK